MLQFVKDIVSRLLAFFAEDGWFMTQHEALMDMLKGVYQHLPAIIWIVIGLVAVFVGKKLLLPVKILGSFAAGFVAGSQLVAPLLYKLFDADATDTRNIIVGCAVGFFALFLFKIVYFLFGCALFAGGGFVGAYFLIERIPSLKEAVASTEHLNLIIAGVVGLIVLIIGMWLRQYVEMLVTALAGSIGVTYGVLRIWNFTKILDWGPASFGGVTLNLSFVVIALIIALLGFVVQIKTKRLY